MAAPSPKCNQPWQGLLLFLAITAVACAMIALAARLVCWCFFIPFHWRYSIGAIVLALMAKWQFGTHSHKH